MLLNLNVSFCCFGIGETVLRMHIKHEFSTAKCHYIQLFHCFYSSSKAPTFPFPPVCCLPFYPHPSLPPPFLSLPVCR